MKPLNVLHQLRKMWGSVLNMKWKHVLNEEGFRAKMVWATSRSLFEKKMIQLLMVSITGGDFLWCKPCYLNMLNYDNYNKCRKLTAI